MAGFGPDDVLSAVDGGAVWGKGGAAPTPSLGTNETSSAADGAKPAELESRCVEDDDAPPAERAPAAAAAPRTPRAPSNIAAPALAGGASLEPSAVTPGASAAPISTSQAGSSTVGSERLPKTFPIQWHCKVRRYHNPTLSMRRCLAKPEGLSLELITQLRSPYGIASRNRFDCLPANN